MKKVLKGFTLAEILITLTIIGVIARVTLPSLMTNTQAQVTAASLAKAINTLEVGNQKIFEQAGSRSLTGASGQALSAASYINLMGTYFNGAIQNNTFVTKDGISFSSGAPIVGLTEPATGGRDLPQKYAGDYIKILIDINGSSTPNTLGRDQFLVYIDNYGTVIPYGGREYANYAGKSTTVLWEKSCKQNQTPNTTNTARAACTGSIIDNGYKVIYAN